jgi:hypothetical protein
VAIAVSGNIVYVGGNFTTAGGNPANYVAKWDGANWSALGSGVDSRVGSLVLVGSNLYALGDFKNAGGRPGNYLAKWDGTYWSTLGAGIDSPGYGGSLAVWGNDLYVGGYFRTAGAKFSPYLARVYLLPLPSLSIACSGAVATLGWPSASASDFSLEQSSAATGSAGWILANAPVFNDGTNSSALLPVTNSAQFFRLRR